MARSVVTVGAYRRARNVVPSIAVVLGFEGAGVRQVEIAGLRRCHRRLTPVVVSSEMPRIPANRSGWRSCRILVASPPSSSTMFGVQLSGPRRVCSVHHSYSSSVSPFQAKTGTRRAAIAAAAWSWVEKMLQLLQRIGAALRDGGELPDKLRGASALARGMRANHPGNPTLPHPRPPFLRACLDISDGNASGPAKIINQPVRLVLEKPLFRTDIGHGFAALWRPDHVSATGCGRRNSNGQVRAQRLRRRSCRSQGIA